MQSHQNNTSSINKLENKEILFRVKCILELIPFVIIGLCPRRVFYIEMEATSNRLIIEKKLLGWVGSGLGGPSGWGVVSSVGAVRSGVGGRTALGEYSCSLGEYASFCLT